MKLHIKNFRSIKQLDLEIAPITVLYGHNGTGKSSALYAPLTLKNIVMNPNQDIQAFFNYGFTSLGTFEEIVFDHNPNNELELGITIEFPNEVKSRSEGFVIETEIDYRITCLNDATGSFRIGITEENRDVPELGKDVLRATLPVSFLERRRTQELFGVNQSDKIFGWNGVSTEDVTPSPYDEAQMPSELVYVSEATIEMLNPPVVELSRVSFVPLGRGFFQPMYSLERERNGSSITSVEQEVTSLLANNRHLEYAVSRRIEEILNRNFHVRADIGSGSKLFSLDAIDRQTGLGAGLVNEGFGVNQLVCMLAKVLHPDAGIVCIEEPEIHLHPTAIRKLARALSEIVRKNTDKHLVISTHSEQFVMSLLALVAEGAHSPVNLAMYLVTKDGKESEFRRQQVNENGQIEGGFASFIEGELEDMKAFLGE